MIKLYCNGVPIKLLDARCEWPDPHFDTFEAMVVLHFTRNVDWSDSYIELNNVQYKILEVKSSAFHTTLHDDHLWAKITLILRNHESDDPLMKFINNHGSWEYTPLTQLPPDAYAVELVEFNDS